jgi:hypothetical protein
MQSIMFSAISTHVITLAPDRNAKWSRIALLVSLLCVILLAGCAGPVKTARPESPPNLTVSQQLAPEIDRRQSARQQMVAIAKQEWERWGRQEVRIGRDDTYCVTVPSSLAPIQTVMMQGAPSNDPATADQEVLDDSEAGLGAVVEGVPCQRFADGSGAEATDQGCQLAQRYWAIVGRVPDCQQVTTGRWAWSATFISWIMRQAGLDTRQFLTGASHAMYVVDARDGILPTPAFGTVALPAMPQIGDLVCGGRGRDKYLNDINEIRFGATPMHCDLVVDVDLSARVVRAIGGNVQQAVSMSLIELGDSNMLDGITNSTMPWLLVLRNQLP